MQLSILGVYGNRCISLFDETLRSPTKMSTINMVRYFFYKNRLPDKQETLQALVAVAYRTARDRKVYPKAILIRYTYLSS